MITIVVPLINHRTHRVFKPLSYGIYGGPTWFFQGGPITFQLIIGGKAERFRAGGRFSEALHSATELRKKKRGSPAVALFSLRWLVKSISLREYH